MDECLILELKSVEKILKVHEAQMLTYLKLTNISAGLLINFYESRLVKGINRYKINYHAYKTWFEFDLEGHPQQNPMGPC
jgi:hypothetical protein